MNSPSLMAMFLCAFLVTAACGGDSAISEAPSISPAALHAERASGTPPLVLDVRSPAEYASGHIPGAINVPFGEVADRLDEIDSSRDVAVYCMIGPRARKGEAALLAAGRENVLHLEGGLSAWQAAGLPVDVSK
jgi:rhodanese-related sulfurtransferase